MIVLSWDVGVINLAYAVIDYNPDKKIPYKLLAWDKLNILDKINLNYTCCAKMENRKVVGKKRNSGSKSKSAFESLKTCGKKASKCVHNPITKEVYGYCKTHKSHGLTREVKFNELIQQRYVEYNLDENHGEPAYCTHYMNGKDDNQCGRAAKYVDVDTMNYFCKTHYLQDFNTKKKSSGLQDIKNSTTGKVSVEVLRDQLIERLDGIIEKIVGLGVEKVLIENQPSVKNPRMKSVSMIINSYFAIRCKRDKIHGSCIKDIQFMCPANKLKLSDDNKLEKYKAERAKKGEACDETKKYKLTKESAVEYTRKLLKYYPEWIEYFDTFKKKDDLADCFIQGLYYLTKR
jgi:hypothetical protein